jgi:hypothetical protein
MSLQACRVAVSVSRIKVEEKGKQAVFLNPGNEEHTKTKVDGCLIRGSTACDWVVSRPDCGDILVELKGCDVDRALEQVRATIKYWKSAGYAQPRIAALVVCSRYPRFDTKLQRAKVEFKRKFNAPIHLFARNIECCVHDLLTYQGRA